MKPLLLFFILVQGCCLFVTAQPIKKNAELPEVYRLISVADQFFERNQLDSALQTAYAAATIARQQHNPRAQAWAISKAAEVLIEKRDLKKAHEIILQANTLASQTNDTLISAITIMQRGQVKMYEDSADQAILLLDKSIKAGLGKYPNEYLALALNDLGYAWGLKDEYEKQAEFTHKSLGVYEKLKNDAGMAIALGNLSTVYYQLGQKEKAIDYGKQSLAYRERTGDISRIALTCCNLCQYYLGINIDEATRYQELCVKYSRQTEDEGRIIHAYITSSLVANAKKNNKEAFEYELKVIDLLEKSKSDQRRLARRYIAAAFYTDMLKYDSLTTIDYFNKSIRLSQQQGDRGNLRDAYLYLSDYHNRKKNFGEAYSSYKKYILYRDSLVNSEKEERIAELESQYETSKKDNEIDRLNNEQRIKQLEIEKQKAIIAGNMATALQKQNEIDLLSKSKELQGVQFKQQAEELEKQQLLVKTNVQQLQLTEKENLLNAKQLRNQKNVRNLLIASLVLFALLGITWFNRFQLKKKLEQQNSVLAMRNNISQDLHDDIGASLSNINILNELARRSINQPEKSKEYLFKASEDIQRINESLSDIVWNINPKYDDLQNLFIRMKRYAADMLDGKNINGQFDFPANEPDVKLSMTQRRDLYLVFKEAVNNLVKYSEAANALIKIATGENTIEMLVEDDGKGFDSEKVKYGNGLHNMMQRAKASGAEVTIRSVPGEGTRVHLVMAIA
jgi:signal transduction histidine kinase